MASLALLMGPPTVEWTPPSPVASPPATAPLLEQSAAHAKVDKAVKCRRLGEACGLGRKGLGQQPGTEVKDSSCALEAHVLRGRPSDVGASIETHRRAAYLAEDGA